MHDWHRERHKASPGLAGQRDVYLLISTPSSQALVDKKPLQPTGTECRLAEPAGRMKLAGVIVAKVQ